MRLIDTHTHLYGEEFDPDREACLQRAAEAGVDTLLLPAIDAETYDRLHALCDAHPDTAFPMMGLHPTSVTDQVDSQLELPHRLLAAHRDRYVAVGEIGLDLYWDRTYEAEQRHALRQQMGWAEECGLPVALHVRNAYEALFEELNAMGRSRYRGVLHCFSGTLAQARQAIEMGFCLGIGGVVTFRNSGLADIVSQLPLESLVLETDAPYLAPAPHRGHRNESAYTRIVAQRVADIKAVSLDAVAETTTHTATRLFDLDHRSPSNSK